jgi:hypothetical protein
MHPRVKGSKERVDSHRENYTRSDGYRNMRPFVQSVRGAVAASRLKARPGHRF